MSYKALYRAGEVITSEMVALAQRAIGEALGKEGSSSRLADSLLTEIDLSGDSLVIKLLMDNYVGYIDRGRKPRSDKLVPIDELRDWALEKGIDVDNGTLYAISQAIWRDGIAPRPILSKIEEYADRAFDERWADLLMDALIDDLTTYFNQ
ncbi:hypothetical protein [Dysgonomonas massiliensis]|uniref:hypothetical protein n=1 Tax=Dysgonomonas massiliensis TaxID=2040292 RepID=UPI000C774C63|nr:hypothetical protein [Dysgonomonas massiliensis]